MCIRNGDVEITKYIYHWVRFEVAPPAQHKQLKNREKIPGKGSAQPRVKIEPLTLGPRGVTAMTVTPQRALVSVGGMAVTYGRYFLAVSEVKRFYL